MSMLEVKLFNGGTATVFVNHTTTITVISGRAAQLVIDGIQYETNETTEQLLEKVKTAVERARRMY